MQTLSEDQKWSGDPLGGAEVVGIPSRRSGSGRETLPEVQKLQTLPEVQKWSVDPLKGPKLSETLPEV